MDFFNSRWCLYGRHLYVRVLILIGVSIVVYISLNSHIKESAFSPPSISPRKAYRSERDMNRLLNETLRIQKYGKYYVLVNYVEAKRTYTGNESVTLTTQGSPAFLRHVEPVCKRWGGPVSMSVYAGSGRELHRALQIISYMKSCAHKCVDENVTWHLIIEQDVPWPKTILEENLYDSPNDGGNLTSAPDWVETWLYDCTVINSTMLYQGAAQEEKPRAVGKGYPINVARNVARFMAKTHYLISSDIELYPSIDIIPRFLKMVSKEKATRASPHVYALPIFEVDKDEEPPEDKATLVKLLKNKRAVFFHQYTCNVCQYFPKRPAWPKHIYPKDHLGIHSKGRRSKSIWEPIYIGTHAEPYYENELTWEGFRDKLSQMFELCLLNYWVYVLDNAFLVHAPGIKTPKSDFGAYRKAFSKPNVAVYSKTINRLKTKYPAMSNKC